MRISEIGDQYWVQVMLSLINIKCNKWSQSEVYRINRHTRNFWDASVFRICSFIGKHLLYELVQFCDFIYSKMLNLHLLIMTHNPTWFKKKTKKLHITIGLTLNTTFMSIKASAKHVSIFCQHNYYFPSFGKPHNLEIVSAAYHALYHLLILL